MSPGSNSPPLTREPPVDAFTLGIRPRDVVVLFHEELPRHPWHEASSPGCANAAVIEVHDDGTLTLQVGVTVAMLEDDVHRLRADAEPDGKVYPRCSMRQPMERARSGQWSHVQ